MKVLVQDCNLEKDNNKELPVSAYIVEYVKDDKVLHDIVIAGHNGTVGIFDHYWDTYKEGLQSISWTKGNVNPRQWNSINSIPPKKKVTKKPRKKDE